MKFLFHFMRSPKYQGWREYQMTLQENRERSRAFASAAAGVCIAVVFVGGLVAIFWGAR